MILHLRAAAAQLYAVPPPRFTPLRAELVAEAKSAGDAELARTIGGLRKPTLAAWAVNHFVREHAAEVEEFREFAVLLREAQRTLDADQLRLLGRERSRRVDELAEKVEAAAAEAGQPLGPAAGAEVRETLTALIADEEAERSVLTGALVKSLRYSGFGSVDIEGVVALEVPAQDAAQDGGHNGAGPVGAGETIDLDERRRARAAAERERLASAAQRARRAVDAADRHVEVLEARRVEAQEGIAALERQLATARQRLEKVTAELEEAGGIRESRGAELAAAEAALEAHDRQS